MSQVRMTKFRRIEEYLTDNPHDSHRKVAEACGASSGLVSLVRRQMLRDEKIKAEKPEPAPVGQRGVPAASKITLKAPDFPIPPEPKRITSASRVPLGVGGSGSGVMPYGSRRPSLVDLVGNRGLARDLEGDAV